MVFNIPHVQQKLIPPALTDSWHCLELGSQVSQIQWTNKTFTFCFLSKRKRHVENTQKLRDFKRSITCNEFKLIIFKSPNKSTVNPCTRVAISTTTSKILKTR